ncbi:hypothetical protein [Elongatibacter sediminis]|uniref:CBM-cenC domain-containing protein n=1 Tax=Elongatibacter sediminis TaxID=3119006 RepID=A0AAW9RCA4_9GAMM
MNIAITKQSKMLPVLLGLLGLAFSQALSAQINLVRNAELDDNIDYWLNPYDRPAEWNSADHEGSNSSGSAKLTNTGTSNGGVSLAIEQCIPARPDTQYEVGGHIQIPANQPDQTTAYLFAYTYESGDCEGSKASTHELSANGVNVWTRVTDVFFTGHNVTSIKIILGVSKPGGETADAAGLFDGLFARAIAGQTGDVLGPSMSTSWYNPSESGHGIMMHLLDATTAWMCWFTFDPAGEPTWICALGSVSGNTVQFDSAFQVEGGVFPPAWDPAKIKEVPWGSITVSFDTCHAGTMTWTTGAAGFQSGSMPIARLLPVWGTYCP